MPDTLYENQISSNGYPEGVMGTWWWGQSFTPSISHQITSVDLRLTRYGQLTGTETFIVEIYATSGGLPTGAAKASGTFTKDQVNVDDVGDWLNIPLTGSSPSLTEGIRYAIVLRAQDEGSSSYIHWLRYWLYSEYSGGDLLLSTNSGSSWSSFGNQDYTFKEYGLVPPIEISGSCSAEGSMAGFAFVDILPIVGSCSAEGSMSGMAYADILPIIGICSAESSMTGTGYISIWPISGSCSAGASMTGTAYIDAFWIIGSCSASASMTGNLTMFLYVVGSMSATAFMTGDTGILWLIPPRRAEYDPDKFWDEETKTWLDSRPIEKVAGGRHKSYFVVVTDLNEIYVGGI